jgi:hypothetical protein
VQDRRRGDDGPKPEVNYLLVAGVPERGVRRAGDGRYACGTMPLVDGAELTAHLHSTVVANDTTYLPNKRDAQVQKVRGVLNYCSSIMYVRTLLTTRTVAKLSCSLWVQPHPQKT